MNTNADAIAHADRLHASLARGWNTWDTRSVLRHVLLPDGLCVRLGFALLDKLVWIDDVHFGQQQAGRTPGTLLTSQDKPLPVGSTIEVRPGAHTYDGSYTCVELNLRGSAFTIETAAKGDEWVALVTPREPSRWKQLLTVHASMLWNQPGYVVAEGENALVAHLPSGHRTIHVIGHADSEPNLPTPSPYVAVRLDGPVAIATSRTMSMELATEWIAAARDAEAATHDRYGELSEAHAAMQASLAWNVIYEPRYRRVIAPVARDWNCWRGGYAIFCWDSFFMAWMMSLDAPQLARACLLEIFREMVDADGGLAFVPNVAQGSGRRSRDRSQPPVGAISVLGMHRQAPDLDTLRAAYPALVAWNRWWHAARRNARGSLSLGSDPYEPRVGDAAEFVQPNTASGAALESGLDNAPIYDAAPFDPTTHLMAVEDVGLNSLYVADCESLAEIARILGHVADAAELDARRDAYASTLSALWSEDHGQYRNRRTDDGAFISRQLLTSFYPMLAGVASTTQVDRMTREHLLNPARYDGDWVLPVSPRDDPAFEEQLYQRGRIWPPNSFLVYLGLCRVGEQATRARLVEGSLRLLLENWRRDRVVAENYNAITGHGGRGAHTQPLYGWSGLLAFTALIEQGSAAVPFDPHVAADVSQSSRS